MLFDLQSPGRRRVLKFVYGALAALFFIGFVGFGVGSEVGQGGIADIFSGGGGDAEENPFEDDINAAEERLQTNPKDAAALAELTELHYSAGVQLVDVDEETGQQSVTEQGQEELQLAADSWAKYEKAAGGKPDTGTATVAVQAFSALADSQIAAAVSSSSGTEALDAADDAIASWEAAAEVQTILAADQPTAADYSNLAFFYYRSGQIPQGDQAMQQALAVAKGAEKQQVQQELAQYKQQGEQLRSGITKLRAEVQKAGAGAGGSNPLGGSLGGGSLGGASPGGALATP